MARPTLILFDVDGTLIHSNGVGGRAWLAAGREVFGEAFTLEGLDFAGQLDRAMFPRAAKLSGVADHHMQRETERFFRVYVQRLGEMLATPGHGLRPLPGARSLVSELAGAARRGEVLLGVLTGNTAAGAWLKLAAAGYDPELFTVNAFGSEADLRPQLTELALHRYARATGGEADPRRVVVIGDTPADVQCATAHGCVALGVTTGRHAADALAAAGADHVLPDLADAIDLITALQ